VLEAEEYFSEGQKGSSAMPHKRNPVASENLCGLARVVRANSFAGMENVALWHERDISHSSVERIVLPDSTMVMDYMLVRFTEIVRTLVIYSDRMQRNLDLTGGLIYSQRLLLELVAHGAPRKDAYEAVQRNAMEAWEGARPVGREPVSAGSGRAGAMAPGKAGRVQWAGPDFKDLVKKDPLITKYLTSAQIDASFDPAYFLRHLDEIYRRVFGRPKTARRGRPR
jgi:adenylosuccinate lyase